MSKLNTIPMDIIEFIHEGPNAYKQFLTGLEHRNLSNHHFEVKITNKNGHPWEPHITETDQCYEINGVKGLRLHLTRGKRYFFTFFPHNDSNYSLIFTTDPVGGKRNESTNYEAKSIQGTPLANKFMSFSFLIKEDPKLFPNVFYYQDRNYTFMGGMIILNSSGRSFISGESIVPSQKNIKHESPSPKKLIHNDQTISPRKLIHNNDQTISPRKLIPNIENDSPRQSPHKERSPRPSHHKHNKSPKKSYHRDNKSPRQSHHKDTKSPKQSHYRENKSPKQSHHRSKRDKKDRDDKLKNKSLSWKDYKKSQRDKEKAKKDKEKKRT